MIARKAILRRLQAACGGVDKPDIAAMIAAHTRGPCPAGYADRVGRFSERARSLASTVTHLPTMAAVPQEVARYLAAQDLSPRLACWPELQGLNWAAASVVPMCRPAVASDLIGVTGVFAAIAETGTLMVVSGETTAPTTSLLPETHIAVLPAARIVDTMEDAFALMRAEKSQWPRAVNLISGPSRTADIEQTVTPGAHGPYRVHIIIVGA
jgi:L-lactate dehydrogenase complex protein LldG